MPKRTIFVCLAIAVCLHAAQAPIGDVIQIEGTWRVEHDPSPLLAGESVPAGALIEADAQKGRGTLVIALLNRKLLSASCTATPCTGVTLQMPASYVDKDVPFANILDAVKFVLLNRGPKVAATYESTSSRSLGFPQAEVLLPFEPSKPISIALDLPGLAEGTYHLEVVRVDDKSIVYSDEVRFESSQLYFSLSLAKGGLYLASVTDRFGKQEADILLQLVDLEAYPKFKGAFEQAQTVRSSWTGEQGSESAHKFLRAYMVALEEQR